MNRRHLIAAVLPAAAAALLAGCASTGQPTLNDAQAAQMQRLIAGARAIDSSFTSIVPALLGVCHVSAQDAANVTTALAALNNVTNALAAQPTIAAGTPYLVAFEAALNAVVTVASTIPVIPEPYHSGLVIAALSLPALESIAGLAVQEGTALAATIKAGRITPAPAAVASK